MEIVKHTRTRTSAGVVIHEITTACGTFASSRLSAAKKLAQKAEEQALRDAAERDGHYRAAMVLARARGWQLLAKLNGGHGPSNNWLFLRPTDEHFGTFASPGEHGPVLAVDGERFETSSAGSFVGLLVGSDDLVMGYLLRGTPHGQAETFYAVAVSGGIAYDATCPGVTEEWLDGPAMKRRAERAASEKADDALVASGQA